MHRSKYLSRLWGVARQIESTWEFRSLGHGGAAVSPTISASWRLDFVYLIAFHEAVGCIHSSLVVGLAVSLWSRYRVRVQSLRFLHSQAADDCPAVCYHSAVGFRRRDAHLFNLTPLEFRLPDVQLCPAWHRGNTDDTRSPFDEEKSRC